MKKFIHLSDLHIGDDEQTSENQYLKVIIDHILRRYKTVKNKPVILITGDITDNGQEDEYKKAVELLSIFKTNGFILKIVPGNHDYGPCGNIYTEKSQDNFKKYILEELLEIKLSYTTNGLFDVYPIVEEVDGVVYIALDSVIDNDNELLHFASGEMGERQLKKLAGILRGYIKTDKVRVAYFHHHPVERSSFLKMDDAQKVMGVLSDVVDFICFGHKHKEEELDGSEYGVRHILASGKSTEVKRVRDIFKPNGEKLNYKEILTYKEVSILDRNNSSITKYELCLTK